MVASDEPLVGEKTEGPLPAKCPGARCCNPFLGWVNKIEGKTDRQKRCKQCLAIVLFFSFWWCLFRGIIQFICFHFATMGCSASALEGYRYPGGGWTCPHNFDPPDQHTGWAAAVSHDPHDSTHCKYTPEDNVVPERSLLLERPSALFGKSFQVFPANSAGTDITQAQVGLWWRTWGPWFYTYTYQDMHSRTSLYMRPTVIGMMGLYSETRIMRCDGAGDVWFFGEGSNWVGNRIRTFFGNVFGMQREGSFKIYRGSEQYGTALETFHGTKSITFQRGTGNDQVTLGSGVLSSNADHQHSDMWSVYKADGVFYRQLPPYYVLSAASVLMGFRWISIRHQRGIGPGPAGTAALEASSPSFLAQTSNASVAFFEETEETGGTLDVHQDPEPLKDGDETANTEASDAVGEKV